MWIDMLKWNWGLKQKISSWPKNRLAHKIDLKAVLTPKFQPKAW